jgi:hypothetical protein
VSVQSPATHIPFQGVELAGRAKSGVAAKVARFSVITVWSSTSGMAP